MLTEIAEKGNLKTGSTLTAASIYYSTYGNKGGKGEKLKCHSDI